MYIPNKKLLSNSKYNSCRNFSGTFKECSRNSVSLVEKYWDRVWRNIKRTSRPATRSFSCRREVAIWQRHAAILKLSLPDRSFLACHSRDLLVFWPCFMSPEKARLFVYTCFISWSNYSISILGNVSLLSSEIHRSVNFTKRVKINVHHNIFRVNYATLYLSCKSIIDDTSTY